MISLPATIAAWQMLQPETRHKETGEIIPGRLKLVQLPVPELGADEVLVEIAGCGVCEADLCYFYDGVATVTPPPLTLGHEIAGTVVAGAPSWLGQEVVIAPGMPCSRGVYGGFASHIPVPASSLFPITNRKTIPLEHMAAVADTVATAFQAASRAEITSGDRVLVVGAGEIEPFVVQMAKAFGAAAVMVVGGGGDRLRPLLGCGADVVINAGNQAPEAIAAEVGRCQENYSLAAAGWKIFETSGTGFGREMAAALLDRAGRLVLLGSEVAADTAAQDRCVTAGAEIIGCRECPPADYPRVVEMVTSGRIILSPFVQTRPMSWIREMFAEARQTPPDKHTILTADDIGLEICPEPKSCR